MADVATGVYLIVYALRRERRDKPAVLIIGSMLMLCAAALVIIPVFQTVHHRPGPPRSPTAPVEQTAGPAVSI